MTGIDQDVWYGPKLGSNILIELYKDKYGQAFISWKYNNQSVNVGGICKDKVDCPVREFINYLKSRMIVGDVGKICRGEQDPWPTGEPPVKEVSEKL